MRGIRGGHSPLDRIREVRKDLSWRSQRLRRSFDLWPYGHVGFGDLDWLT